jgi:transcriptional regulator with XRE-family HTH domain
MKQTRPSINRQFEFDPIGFAQWLFAQRKERGWSTRDLAERAGISQPYVVALERARSGEARRGPTPTVDVVAALAHALDKDILDMFVYSLRPVGRHVLLVTQGKATPPLDILRAESGETVDNWVHPITLHREKSATYDKKKISQQLSTELAEMKDGIDGKNVGLVFTETSNVMQYVSNPQAVIDFEHKWADVVAEAVKSVGGHAAWNVCVYTADSMQNLPKGEESVNVLFETHNEIWYASGDEVVIGETAKQKILQLVA